MGGAYLNCAAFTKDEVTIMLITKITCNINVAFASYVSLFL